MTVFELRQYIESRTPAWWLLIPLTIPLAMIVSFLLMEWRHVKKKKRRLIQTHPGERNDTHT